MVLTTFASIFVFVGLSLFLIWMLRGVGKPVDERVRSLALARQQGGGLADLPFQERVVAPLIESIGRWVGALLPGAYARRTERRLVLAGRPMRLAAFYTMVLISGALFAGVYLLLLVAGGVSTLLAYLPAIPLGLFGMYLPLFWLSSQARARQNAMVRGLPDSLDLLTICVEAGLGLDQAFQRVTEKQSGPIVDEFRQMLREIGLGKTRRQALEDLAERTDLDDVRAFANAVIQAERLGTSLAQVLRVQSQRLRVRRRQRAEQEARRAPVKMVFPLVFCLMPSLFIFIIGPIIVNVINYLAD
jgi:tight adherence protein C